MRRFLSLAVISAATACASHTPDPETEPEAVGARLGTVEAPIKPGDCAEALRRALAKPDLDVEKVPAPVDGKGNRVDPGAMTPPPIDARKMPRTVPDKNGYYQVRFQVLVDTLGKPDMKTFAVVSTTHPWLGTSVKSAVAKWKFAPAEVAGCKVPRNFVLGISPRGKTPAKPAARKPPTR
jgi:hypothetical protein